MNSAYLQNHFSQWPRPWLVSLTAVFLFFFAFAAPNIYTGSDPHFSMLVSQAIVQDGTIILDAYAEQIPEQFAQFRYQLKYGEAGITYAFPIGTSLLVSPFVLMANLLGFDMTQMADNYLWQKILSAVSVALVFVAIYHLSLCYVNRASAYIISFAVLMGSSLVSTLATALWSLNLTVLSLAFALLLLCQHATSGKAPNPYILGFLLFAAFLCRPTAALFIIIAFYYLWRYDRALLWPTAVTAAALLALSIAYNYSLFGTLIPDYYLPSRLGDSAGRTLPTYTFGETIYGLLLSPGRGFFSFTPWAFVVLIGVLRYGRSLASQRPWFLLALVWWVGHLLVVSRFPHWWGGTSYGPRLLADTLPAVVLLLAQLAKHIESASSRRLWYGGFSVLALVSIGIHSWAGLVNVNTVLWNVTPNVDEHSHMLFDWRYPQFAATATRNTERWHLETLSQIEGGHFDLPQYQWGNALKIASPQSLYMGWWSPRPGEWWTDADTAYIVFQTDELVAPTYRFEISSQALGQQSTTVLLNDQPLGSFVFADEMQVHEVVIDADQLSENGTNIVTIGVTAQRPFDQLQTLGLNFVRHRIALKNTKIAVHPITEP